MAAKVGRDLMEGSGGAIVRRNQLIMSSGYLSFFFCPLFARTIFFRGSRQKITLTKKSGQICPRAKKTIPIIFKD